MSATSEPRKAGVSSPTDLKEFVSSAGSSLLVVDVRHPDASVEPGDAKSLAVAGFPDKESNYRPNAINLPWSRESNSMEVPEVDKDTPIISLACAHPAKFSEAVQKATGQIAALPDSLADLMEREENMLKVDNDMTAVQQLVLKWQRG